jgi:hypothetical protein
MNNLMGLHNMTIPEFLSGPSYKDTKRHTATATASNLRNVVNGHSAKINYLLQCEALHVAMFDRDGAS